MCNEYNGHKNYPTWCVNLWIDNDQGTYNTLREMAIEAYNNAKGDKYNTKKERAIYNLTEQIKDLFDSEYNPLIDQANMYSDLLGWVLSKVEWYDIAEDWIEYIIEEELVEVDTELELQE